LLYLFISSISIRSS